MKTAEGIVQNIRHETGSSDGKSHSVAILRVEDQNVELRIMESIFIDTGDYVAVAGKLKKGSLQAYAYNNFSNNTNGKLPSKSIIAFSIFVFIFGLATIWLFGLGLIAMGLAIWMFIKGLQMQSAYKKVMNSKPPK